MPKRAHIIIAAAVLAIAPCHAAQPSDRDGSTKAKAIRLKQRDPANAVEEEMQWMMKLYHYTPVLATRDLTIDAVRKKKNLQDLDPWVHRTVGYQGKLLSYWSFATPHGRKEIYFDTGTFINTPGEV